MVYLYAIAQYVPNGCGYDYIKVGVTYNLTSRLSSLQTGNHGTLELFSYREFPTRIAALAAEKRAHFVMRNYRAVGEWFKIEEDNFVLYEALSLGRGTHGQAIY